jgi:hypothetical protein
VKWPYQSEATADIEVQAAIVLPVNSANAFFLRSCTSSAICVFLLIEKISFEDRNFSVCRDEPAIDQFRKGSGLPRARIHREFQNCKMLLRLL